MGGSLKNGRENESDWVFSVAEKMSVVQGKVTSLNILIHKSFLKGWRYKNASFFVPSFGQIACSKSALPGGVERPFDAAFVPRSCAGSRVGL
jgi:hypothetical protein